MIDSKTENNGLTVITLEDSFDTHAIEAFRQAYQKAPGSAYVVDFRSTEYMDSSGLGMLLNMRRHLGDDMPIRLVNCRPQVKRILQISRFDTQFDIT